MVSKKRRVFDMELKRGYNRRNTKRRTIPVTVCIAALCDNDKSLVCVSDRMITSGDVLFETPRSKIYEPESRFCIMTAGDISTHRIIYERLFDRLDACANENNILNIREIVSIYESLYDEYKNGMAERAVLSPLGLTRREFIDRQDTMDTEFIDNISDRLSEYKIGDIDTIIAGFDGSKLGGHIYVIRDGVSSCESQVGFGVIGIGERHADSQFMMAGHCGYDPFYETLLLSYCAKKRAEVAPGVGKETDILINRAGMEQARIPNESEIFSVLEAEYNRMRGAEQKAKKISETQAAQRIRQSPTGDNEKIRRLLDGL